jgi:imidazoleglycerol-phosphate dehydratase
MLDQIARHGLIDLEVEAQGDLHIDGHHTVEDVGITLGMAVAQAVGDKAGITRYGHAYVPMDETLSRVVVDLSNRPWLEFRAPADTPDAQNFPFSLVEEFFRALSSNLRANVHVEIFYGRDGHHIAESAFKGLARALRVAVRRDPRVKGVPSTKEIL